MKNMVVSKKPFIVIWLIVTLLFLFNLGNIVVSSTYVYDENDSVFYDDFEGYTGLDDVDSIEDYDQCVLSNSVIKLKEDEHEYDFDFSDNKGHRAWDVRLSSIFSSDSDLMRMRNLLGQSSVNIEKLEANDDKVVRTKSRVLEMLNITFSPVHHFRFKVGQYGQYLDYLELAWYGNYSNDANIDSIEIYIWNYSALFGVGIWENIGSIPYDSNIGSNPDGDIQIMSSQKSFISNEGDMDFLIVATPLKQGKRTVLDTDYVEVEVKTLESYAREGYVISKLIEPSLGRWDSIIWSGSPLSGSSGLKIQVLNSTGVLVEDYILPGNSNGFNTSPVDISDITGYLDSIKIKISLQSKYLSVSPWLKNWGVIWQKSNGRFHDDFLTSLRLDKTYGLDIYSDKIHMDDNYGDWPIFGKNPMNTRSYEGFGPDTASLYGYTQAKPVGGGLRSPILEDGTIYVASPIDNKIYAFNANQIDNELQLVRNSDSLPYRVDSSVAVADDLVIAATSEMNTSNKVYALDKHTLNEEWIYTYSLNESICYSSTPTISNGKIFVTSWNGMSWETPLLYMFYQLNIIQGNNKIIVLNQSDGSEIWNATLPAGSFSTPAVADGMVFVGCDNIMGGSLLAFDEETGVKIWEANVGLVGGASPVVHNDQVFIVGKDQGTISLTGDVKVFAVDEYKGDILWNKIIAKKIIAFENVPKALRLYNIKATCTPTVYENKLFVTSPDGKLHALSIKDGSKIWNVNLSSGIFNLLPIKPCTSPVVTSSKVYTTTVDGVIHAINSMSGKKLWDFNCKTSGEEFSELNYILSAPIVADGVLYVSVTEELENLSGRIHSVGNYTSMQVAKMVSKPIVVPVDKWWEKFNADFSAPDNTSILFRVLDQDYNLLSYVADGSDYISYPYIIDTNKIRLSATFFREKTDLNPTLDSWSIQLKNNHKPDYDRASFIPNPDGWINTNSTLCSIYVIDEMPGLDVDSARFFIKYVTKFGKTESSEWINANCTGVYGTRLSQIITADVPVLNISIAELKSITFSIKDIAGYESKTYFGFYTDKINPKSSIIDVNNFSSNYNKSVVITANASDPGDPEVNSSGVDSVVLRYKLIDSNEWVNYSRDQEPAFKWSFETDKSGEYEFCTIATDNATNVENLPSQGDLSFIFDKNQPNPPTYEKPDLYRFNNAPEFIGRRSIHFSDDYKLMNIEYRLNFYGIDEWNKINEKNINSKTFQKTWNLTSNDWEVMRENENYTLYFRLTDTSGNKYITPEDEALTIIKDLTVSKSYLDTSDFEKWHWGDQFNLSVLVPDSEDITSIKLFYRYSSNKEEDWSEWEQYGDTLTSPTFKWDFTAKEGSGYYEFKVKAEDYAGNIGESKIESITLTLFPLVQIAMLIILGVVLSLMTFLIHKKMKTK